MFWCKYRGTCSKEKVEIQLFRINTTRYFVTVVIFVNFPTCFNPLMGLYQAFSPMHY